MKQYDIVWAAQETAQIPTRAQAEAAVRATLRVLGEQLADDQTRVLTFRLPPDLAREIPEQAGEQQLDLPEFYEQVARYEGTSAGGEQARRHARAVAAALRTSLTGREFDQLAAQLPSAYDDLLHIGPTQLQ